MKKSLEERIKDEKIFCLYIYRYTAYAARIIEVFQCESDMGKRYDRVCPFLM